MNCKKAKSMLLPFLRDELSPDEVEDLSRHLKECPRCREDLEIYYIVQVGIDGLSRGSFSTYDLKEQFEREVSEKTAAAHRHLRLRYTANVLSVAAIAAAVAAGISLVISWL